MRERGRGDRVCDRLGVLLSPRLIERRGVRMMGDREWPPPWPLRAGRESRERDRRTERERERERVTLRRSRLRDRDRDLEGYGEKRQSSD